MLNVYIYCLNDRESQNLQSDSGSMFTAYLTVLGSPIYIPLSPCSFSVIRPLATAICKI